MEYQPIEADDLEECAILFARAFGIPPWNEAWDSTTAKNRLTDIFNTPGFLGLKVLDGRTLVGFLMGYAEPYHARVDFYLKEMCVDPTLQRKGIGSVLLGHFRELASSKGISQMYLLTAKESSAARFYAKNGFRMNDRVSLMTQRLAERR